MSNIVIIGAGPAGLTAAIELQYGEGVKITILEADSLVGGISKTLNYKGNRIDIGGHRFFSKSKWVMEWWQNLLPIASTKEENTIRIKYQNNLADLKLKKYSEDLNDVMLVRNRVSRILFNRKFFSYPLKLNLGTLWKIGILK